MQTFGFKTLLQSHLLRQPLRHRHTPMHTRRTIDQNHDALAPWLTLHSPPERFPGAVILRFVCWKGEEALPDLVV